MRIIFHIGMGKTGTTSIQAALAQSADALEKKKMCYLGMWFEAANPDFKGLAGFGKFVAQNPRGLEQSASRFFSHLEALSKKNKATTFVLSNESLFQNGPRLEPFFKKLQGLGAKLTFVAYVRDPRTWLPSAHTQWALRHKTNKGKVQDFETSARRLIKFYDAIPFWTAQFGNETQFRKAGTERDVVSDFAQAIDVSLTSLPGRALERSEPADTLLRAMFNNRISDQAMPSRFSGVVYDTDTKAIPSAQDLARICFDHSKVETVIAENTGVFEVLRDKTGIDFLDDPAQPSNIPDQSALQSRVIDYLIEITFDQARRLRRLERLVNDLQKD